MGKLYTGFQYFRQWRIFHPTETRQRTDSRFISSHIIHNVIITFTDIILYLYKKEARKKLPASFFSQMC